MNKRIYNGWFLMTLFFIAGFIHSCKKEDNPNAGNVELLSFGPTGVKHGEQIRFIGNNLHKVTAIELPGAIVNQSEFVEQTTEKIALVVPVSASEGLITLKTPEGDIVSKTKINFEVPVVITNFTTQVRPGDNLTISGEFLNWVKEIRFAEDILVTEFESQTLQELVVKVPVNARTGTLVLSTGGTEPLVIETDTELVVTLPVITDFSPNPVERNTDITITGTDLDLVMGILFKGLNTPITTFKNQTATEIVVTVPDEANKGKITAVAHSGIEVESADVMELVGDLPPLAPLAYAMYIDKLENNWQDWGWSRTADFTNTDNVRDGSASIKLNYSGQWGALKFANGNVATAPYSEITFSIFGTPGTGGQKINVSANGGPAYTITITEGEWVEYKLSKADLGNPANITNLVFQCQSWTGIVYFDHVGLR